MPPSAVQFDEIGLGGKHRGSVAEVLLANDMNPEALRVNDVLRKDEWKQLDDVVVEISKQRMVGVADLVNAGLVFNLENGLGTTVLEFETESDMADAQLSMDAITRGRADAQEFEIGYLPLPIAHKDFNINIRVLNASRKLGRPLDTTRAATSSRKVVEIIEQTLFRGAGTFKFGGGNLYGYCNHPSRQTLSLGTAWDTSGVTGAQILAKVLDACALLDAKKRYGKCNLYVPTAYGAVLDDDFKANTTDTIRARLKMIDRINDVKVADKLSADNVVLVEMVPETARMVIGFQPTTFQWESEGGFQLNFKAAALMVPQIRADYDGNCGVVHIS